MTLNRIWEYIFVERKGYFESFFCYLGATIIFIVILPVWKWEKLSGAIMRDGD